MPHLPPATPYTSVPPPTVTSAPPPPVASSPPHTFNPHPTPPPTPPYPLPSSDPLLLPHLYPSLTSFSFSSGILEVYTLGLRTGALAPGGSRGELRVYRQSPSPKYRVPQIIQPYLCCHPCPTWVYLVREHCHCSPTPSLSLMGLFKLQPLSEVFGRKMPWLCVG
jgi:hypothetical protein